MPDYAQSRPVARDAPALGPRQSTLEVATIFLTPDFGLAALTVLVAGLSRGMLGFGATLMAVPCLVTIYGPIEAVVIASIIEIPAVLALLPSAIRDADWRYIAPVGAASLTTIPLGAWFLVSVDPEVARRTIAIAVIGFALMLASGWRYRSAPGLFTKLAVGAASGITSGLANIGGPIVVTFLVASNQAAAGVRSGIMAYFSISAAYRIAVYFGLGIYAMPFVLVAAALAVPYLLGIWTGARLYRKVSERLFMRLAIGLVMAAGLVALVR